MERMEEIKGFIIYTQDQPKEPKPASDEAQDSVVNMGAQNNEIIEKFKDKTLKDFVPSFILAQFEHDKSMEYADFDQCVDEYFS
jgi:hypothetical protein